MSDNLKHFLLLTGIIQTTSQLTLASQTFNESGKKWDTVIGKHSCPASPEMTGESQWFVFFAENPVFFSMSLSSFIHSIFTPVAFNICDFKCV